MKNGIGYRILKAIERHPFINSQSDLGRETNLYPATINKWVSEKSIPDSLKLAQVAKALGTSTDYLVGLTDNPNAYYGEIRGASYAISMLTMVKFSDMVNPYIFLEKPKSTHPVMRNRIVSDVDNLIAVCMDSNEFSSVAGSRDCLIVNFKPDYKVNHLVIYKSVEEEKVYIGKYHPLEKCKNHMIFEVNGKIFEYHKNDIILLGRIIAINKYLEGAEE